LTPLTGDRLRRLRVPCLAIALAISAWLGFDAARIGVEHDNSSLRSDNTTDRDAYADFKTTFGSDEDIFVAIAHPLDASGLQLIADVTARIQAMDGVRKAWSLVNVEEIVPGDTGPEPRPMLSPPWDAPGIAEQTSAALDRNPDFTGWLVSADRKTAGIVVEIEERPGDSDYRANLVASIRGLSPVVAAGGGEMHLTGVPVQKIDVSDYVDRDQAVLLPAAVLVLGLTLALFFRHISGVVVPLAVAGITVLWTIGAYAATGHSLNAITALLPPVLLVIALATAVHVYDAWLAGHTPPDIEAGDRPRGMEHGSNPRNEDRAALAVRAVFVPALLCAVTTAQGFLSLLIGGDLPAVHEFGVFAAFGSLVAFVVAMTIVPVALAGVKPPPHRASF
jgi:predicted RND superfamily exporter protein